MLTPDDVQRAIYEDPFVSACGPVWSALASGFATYSFAGELVITPAGQRYLETIEPMETLQ